VILTVFKWLLYGEEKRLGEGKRLREQKG